MGREGCTRGIDPAARCPPQTHWRPRRTGDTLRFRRCAHSPAPAAPDRAGVGTQLPPHSKSTPPFPSALAPW